MGCAVSNKAVSIIPHESKIPQRPEVPTLEKSTSCVYIITDSTF